MKFIFWQGIISIHQKTFLEAVANQPGVEQVTLVVAHDITPYRKSMGWEVPEIKNVTVIISPSIDEVNKLVATNKDAIHITGGIRVGKMLSAAFDACIKHKCRLGIMTEPYNPAGIKGRLRTLKYHYYRARYAKHIQFILAIGKQGIEQFHHLGFAPKKIFPWAYFINIDNASAITGSAANIRRIIYAGRIEEAKGIYRFAEELANATANNYTLDIYGEGADEAKLKQLIADKNLSGRINIYPFLKHDNLIKKYPAYDWVVLPSTAKDGWGVITSEGLLHGLKAICSSICGVSLVIKENFNGTVFDWNEANSCKAAISKMLTDDNFADAGKISSWAQQTISADAGAAYFIDITNCVYAHKQKPPAPWDAYKG